MKTSQLRDVGLRLLMTSDSIRCSGCNY